MNKLNFPTYEFRIKSKENKQFIFDQIRRKFVHLSPEEWVRQHTVQFLINEKNYPKSLLNVEKQINVSGIPKRYDIIVFNTNGSIFLIVECKSSQIKIKQETFDQIARYNMALKANYLMVTNGIDHYYCQMDYAEKRYTFLHQIPLYKFKTS